MNVQAPHQPQHQHQHQPAPTLPETIKDKVSDLVVKGTEVLASVSLCTYSGLNLATAIRSPSSHLSISLPLSMTIFSAMLVCNSARSTYELWKALDQVSVPTNTADMRSATTPGPETELSAV